MANTYPSAHYQMDNGARQQSENKIGWKYKSCECCPYGYHIDLDFVRYCDSLKERVDYTGSINKRRERRRQRQSMEVLLGLAPTSTPTFSTFPRTTEHNSLQNHLENADNSSARFAILQDALGEVVTDFERTLERSNGSTSANNTFDSAVEIIQRASSNSSVSSGSGCGSWLETSGTTSAFAPTTNTAAFTKPAGINGDLDASKCSNADTLKNIRKQMALGLERMRELEDQVKLIPALQVQVSILKDEKRKLLEMIREQSATVKELNTKVLAETTQKYAVASRRDAAVMCSTITRTIGVGPQYPKTRNIATETAAIEIPMRKSTPDSLTKSQSTQTHRLLLEDAGVQTAEFVKHVQSCGVTVKPDTIDFALQIGAQLRTVGISNDSILDNVCNKCNILTRTIAVGPGTGTDNLMMPISLKSLSVPRSKSFNLGEEKLGHNPNSRYRTVGCQSEKFCMNRACQYEPKVSSRACQYEPIRKIVHKSVQSDPVSVMTQFTETLELTPSKKDATCNTIPLLTVTASINTVRLLLTDASSNTRSPILTETSSNTDPVQCYDDGTKKEETTPISRIPRTSIPVPVSSERHKLRRQDTYTKIPAVVVNSGLSGIELSPTTPTQTIDTVEPETTNNSSLTTLSPEASKSTSSPVKHSEANDYSENKDDLLHISLPVSDSAFFNQIDRSSRTKAVPSKEMQAAMKVLNDSLQKSKLTGGNMSSNAKSHLKNALSIIQQEWFKMSSLVSADPLNVEDYLDRFEEISSVLLQYIVNMTDDSGNTAMHYAVSHGNFDVVSILLDSKVCNINKPNKAGYTSVMLVSLTEVRSPTDATVVKRLFQLADVNVRAKQHGQTALMLAVSHGRLDMVQMLLESGADINIQDEDGSTALMCAAEHGHIEIVKYFLGHPECDSSILDVDGSTALKIALEAGHKDIGVLLYAHEHSVHGVSPYSSLKQRKSKNPSNASSTAVSRSPSRGALSNKSSK